MSGERNGGRRHRGRWERVGRRLAYGASLLMLGATVAGFSAHYVPGGRAWGVQVAALALPWLTAGVGALTLLWSAWRRWGLAIGHGGVLACVLLRGATAPWEGDASPPKGPTLTVVSFNGKVGAGNATAGSMQEMLRTVAPDVVALQEFPLRVLPGIGVAGAPLIAPLLQAGYRVAGPGSGEGQGDWPRPIFSRLPLEGAPQVLAGGEGLWERGGVTRVEARWEGRPIALYNVHLHSFGPARPWENGAVISPAAWREALRTYRADFHTRAEQARVLRRWLEAEPLPFVVCADLNSTPAHWVFRHLAQGLQDSFALAGEGWGMTYPARLPLFRIDYVLASPHWTVRRAYVYSAVSSDHRPVVAELSLNVPGVRRTGAAGEAGQALRDELNF